MVLYAASSASTDKHRLQSLLSVVLYAASFASTDKHRLQSLLQAQREGSDDDAGPGAPAAAAYKSQTGGIFDVLEGLREKAEGQLTDLRKAEPNTKHKYELLRSSPEAQKAVDTKDMSKDKRAVLRQWSRRTAASLGPVRGRSGLEGRHEP